MPGEPPPPIAVPTHNFSRFRMAKEMHCTVATLLDGQARPLAAMEDYLWNRWHAAHVVLERAAKK